MVTVQPVSDFFFVCFGSFYCVGGGGITFYSIIIYIWKLNKTSKITQKDTNNIYH